MNFLDNLVISLCFTFNLCDRSQVLFIRPSLSLMPEEVFTNQANYERVKGKNNYKIFNKWMVLNHRGVNSTRKGRIQVRLPLPDLSMKVDKIPGFVYFKLNPAVYPGDLLCLDRRAVMISLCYSQADF
jgi:hypothetical protein